MRSMKTAVIALLMGMASLVWAESSPVPMLENTANQIIAALNQNKQQLKKNPSIVYQAVEKYFLPQVDVEGMSRSVLGRQAWNKATVAEKKQFSQAFTRLVIRTYATPLVQYTDEKVKFLPLRSTNNGRFVRVNSIIIRSTGQNIPLSYSLVAKNGGWKIYDMSVEGVSLLQSFRSQFAQALQNTNMQALIQQMQQMKKAA